MNRTPSELERQAYISGDLARADLLARVADTSDELNRLRAMYWTLCRLFPFKSDIKKADCIEKMQVAWYALQNAGEVNDID